MARLNFRSGSGEHPDFRLTDNQVSELEAILDTSLSNDAKQAIESKVSLYLHHLPMEFDADSSPIRKYYIACEKALRRAEEVISAGPKSDDRDVVTWAKLGFQTSRRLRDDPEIPRLRYQVKFAAENFARALVWLSQNEDSSPGRRTNEAMDSFVMRLALDFSPLFGMMATESYSEYRESSSDECGEHGNHSTVFVRFVNKLYEFLPEEAQGLESSAKEGPATSTIRRVLKELRRRGELRQKPT